MKRTLGSIYIWTYIAVLFTSILLLVSITWVITAPFDKQRLLCNTIMVKLGSFVIRLNPGWKVEISGSEKLKELNQGAVILSNHQSFMDMPLQGYMKTNFKWVARSELFKIPVMGWFMSICKVVSVDRDKGSAANLLKQTKPLLKEGVSVLIFPEGTRSRDNNLKRFKKGAFIIAQETNAPILPVVLDGAYQTLPPKSWKYRLNATLKLSILDPLYLKDYNSVDDLMNESHAKMEAELDRLRGITKSEPDETQKMDQK